MKTVVALDSDDQGKTDFAAVTDSRQEPPVWVVAAYEDGEWTAQYGVRTAGVNSGTKGEQLALPPCFSFDQECIDAFNLLREQS